MNVILQISNDINFMNELEKNNYGSESLAFEITKAVPLFSFSLVLLKLE